MQASTPPERAAAVFEPHLHRSAFGELDRIGEQIVDDLAHAEWVAENAPVSVAPEQSSFNRTAIPFCAALQPYGISGNLPLRTAG